MGFIPSKYAPFTKKGILVIPYISLMNKKKKIVDIMMTQSQTVTNSHKQELVFLCTEVYRTPSHKYIKMTVTKTNVTISLMQPIDISMD